MLALLRRKARSPIIQAAIVIIILVFVFWLPQMGGDGGPGTVAVVNGEAISSGEFQRRYDDLLAGYREQLGGVVSPELLAALGIREQVLNRLIQEKLLLQSALNTGLPATPEEVRTRVQSMEEFQRNGAFDLELYKQVLNASRLGAQDFEAQIAFDLLRNKIVTHLSGFAWVREVELRERFHRDHDELGLDYLTFSAADFRDQQNPGEEEIAAFYQENSRRYQSLPRVRIEYILLNDNGDAQAAFAKAGEVYENILTLGSLEDGAKEAGVVSHTSDFFSRVNPPAELLDHPEAVNAAFSLAQGELSSIVDTAGGYAVVFVGERREPQLLPLEEVEAEVRGALVEEMAAKAASLAALAALERVKSGEKLTQVAHSLDKEVVESPLFTRAGTPPESLPEAVRRAGSSLGLSVPVADTVASSAGNFHVVVLREERLADGQLFELKARELRQELLTAKREAVIDSWIGYLMENSEILISEN